MRRKKIANNTYISLSSKGLFNLNNLILIQMKKNNRYMTQVPTKTGTLDTITQVNLLHLYWVLRSINLMRILFWVMTAGLGPPSLMTECLRYVSVLQLVFIPASPCIYISQFLLSNKKSMTNFAWTHEEKYLASITIASFSFVQ